MTSKKVTLRICGPAVLLGLKAWALKDRNKFKDGYDVVWILTADGASTAARRFREARLHETDFGVKALNLLEECFQTYKHTGPVGWVTESGFDGDEAALEARQSSGLVQEFVRLARHPDANIAGVRLL